MSAGLPTDALSNVAALAFDPVRPGVVYAGTRYGVLVTTGGGARWARVNAGLPRRWVWSLAVDAAGTRIYAGTDGGGVAVARLPLAGH